MLPPEGREHAPRRVLDGGAGGAGVHRRVAAGARRWLAPGGSLLIETGREQAELTARAIAEHRLVPHVMSSEEMYCTVVLGVDPNI
jgi:release factor glutamine methyltransferase